MYQKVKGKFDATLLLNKYPDSVPVILTKAPRSTLPSLTKTKYLLNSSNTVSDLYNIIRKQMDLPPEIALFFFMGNTIPSISATFGELYRNFKSSDNVLYFTYADENVYGENAKHY